MVKYQIYQNQTKSKAETQVFRPIPSLITNKEVNLQAWIFKKK